GLSPDAVGENLAALGLAELEIVHQRIDLRGRDIRIGRKIRRGVEVHRWIASLAPAKLVVVIERVGAACRNIGVGCEIAPRVEQRIRIAPLLPAELLEMPEWI